jgi:GNAT superfamily N-acetyltransferase
MPEAPSADCAPELACLMMERELDALSLDIEAARERLRRGPGRLDWRRGDVQGPTENDERVALAEERVIVIRPVEPSDGRELIRLFARLGALSRFRRFLAPLEHLSRRQVEYLTCVDHRSHEALIAFDAKTDEGIGIARYLCDPRDLRRARFAVAVVDAWHGRGAGAALLARLRERALDNGIDSLSGSTVASNAAARGLQATSVVNPRAGTLLLSIRPRDADPFTVSLLASQALGMTSERRSEGAVRGADERKASHPVVLPLPPAYVGALDEDSDQPGA